MPFAADFLARLAPRDPIEELLAFELLWNHARVMKLSLLANTLSDLPAVLNTNAAADSAACTTRKLVRALDEHRHPRREGKVYAIQQANVAEKQIFNNVTVSGAEHASGPERAASEGTSATPAGDAPEAQVRALAGGAGKIEVDDRAQQALAAEHGPAHGERQGELQPQRAAPRGALGRDAGATAVDPRNASTPPVDQAVVGGGGGGDDRS